MVDIQRVLIMYNMKWFDIDYLDIIINITFSVIALHRNNYPNVSYSTFPEVG